MPARRMSGRIETEIVRVTDFSAVGRLWREIEARAGPLPLFRRWTWVGCLAEERFDDPWLVTVAEDGQLCGAALFNRRRGTLWLGESGEPVRDTPFVEHNGPVLAAGAGAEVLRALFAAAWRVPGVVRLRLSGVAEAVIAEAGGVAGETLVRPLYWVDLDTVRRAGDALGHVSPNTRAQLRRAWRAFGGPDARLEPLSGEAALEDLIAAHQAWWGARGQPGAFAPGFMRRFHHALLARGEASGEVRLRLLRAPDGRPAAWLHLLCSGGHVAAYQSAITLAEDLQRLKPGLVAHLLAIVEAAAEGAARYDFLAGEARYKRSVATHSGALLWAERVRPWSIAHLLARVRQGFRAIPMARLGQRPAHAVDAR